jgi:hypothetical protein
VASAYAAQTSAHSGQFRPFLQARVPYDAVPLIRQLQREGATGKFWEEVWTELHHQGDLGEAAYALVPYLGDYQSRQQQLDEQLLHFCVLVDLEQPENHRHGFPSLVWRRSARRKRRCSLSAVSPPCTSSDPCRTRTSLPKTALRRDRRA